MCSRLPQEQAKTYAQPAWETVLEDGNSKGSQRSCNTVTQNVKKLQSAAQPYFY